MASNWNDWTQIKKTQKPHMCAITGEPIPVESSCWKFVGEWDGDFQAWYCTNEAKEFMDSLPTDGEGHSCGDVGEQMRERAMVQ